VPGLRGRIFERFFSAGKAGAAMGHGAALPVAKGTAALHRAEIVVKSEPDRASAFTVRPQAVSRGGRAAHRPTVM